MTHPSSFVCNDLVVKSLTQSSKHRWTSLEYICVAALYQHSCSVRINQGGLGDFEYGLMGKAEDGTHGHELLHLLLLHPGLQLSLLCRIKTGESQDQYLL